MAAAWRSCGDPGQLSLQGCWAQGPCPRAEGTWCSWSWSGCPGPPEAAGRAPGSRAKPRAALPAEPAHSRKQWVPGAQRSVAQALATGDGETPSHRGGLRCQGRVLRQLSPHTPSSTPRRTGRGPQDPPNASAGEGVQRRWPGPGHGTSRSCVAMGGGGTPLGWCMRAARWGHVHAQLRATPNCLCGIHLSPPVSTEARAPLPCCVGTLPVSSLSWAEAVAYATLGGQLGN